ncbi:hypothetical protein [Hyphomonas sp.]|uniref:hypothetical protein n=1 Tax=Hyphomonas sp. TaxID=87 RepID=UPI00352911A0
MFRSILLTGLILFFAAQQALCACALAGTPEPAGMAITHEMAGGHACEEAGAPVHDESTCPHCQSGKAPLFQMVQPAPAPVILAAPTPVLFQMVEAIGPPSFDAGPAPRQAYESHAPPRRTPLQLKTRFLN